jgi:hypothetical protein
MSHEVMATSSHSNSPARGIKKGIRGTAARTCSGALIVAALAGPIRAQVTTRVSISTGGVQQNQGSYSGRAYAGGRYVYFTSNATNLVAGDTNGWSDAFLRDRWSGTTERVSVNTNEGQLPTPSFAGSMSADGRYATFTTFIGFGTTTEVYLRDRQSGTTTRVDVSSGGAMANNSSQGGGLSDDGRYVTFESDATNLVAGDTNGVTDVFLRDLVNGTTMRVSVSSGGAQGNDGSYGGGISPDNRYVSFLTYATNLAPGDTAGWVDLYVRDLVSGTTERVLLASGGGEANYDIMGGVFSADRRFVAFQSFASNLVAGDTNGVIDVFVHDRQTLLTERVSVGSAGEQGSFFSYFGGMSSDGRYVPFFSDSPNFVAGDTNAKRDVFLRDRQNGTTLRLSVDSSGVQGNGHSEYPLISSDGRYVGFSSAATNLVSVDTNAAQDTFIHDIDATSFTSQCDPGVGGVIACPCLNPPSGLGRGCDNSSATGGAILTASGVAYLSMDSLVFTTSGEKPTALSIVAQWIGGSASGAVFGMGVRCTSGTLKRLFSKSAVAGSITVPNFGAGDPTVSAQSALKGDTILAGQSRWYVVYYRDNTILGGCSATSNFNATQTGRVAWSP